MIKGVAEAIPNALERIWPLAAEALPEIVGGAIPEGVFV
jgi:hypothetical protein